MFEIRKWLLVFLLFCSPAALYADETVDINTADSETLVDGLVGVGPHKAMAIIQYRQAHGPFRTVEELANVKGIGARLIDQNRTRLVVMPANASVKTR
jgi:competence protein ComEA